MDWPKTVLRRGGTSIVLETSRSDPKERVSQHARLQWFAVHGVRAFIVYLRQIKEVQTDGVCTPIEPAALETAFVRAPTKTPSDKTARIVERLKSGDALVTIAKEFGLTRQRIHSIRKRHAREIEAAA